MWGNRLNAWNTIPIRRRIRSTSTPVRRDLVALDDDPAGVDRLEQVDAAQERRLAAPRRPDQADDLVLGELEVDPAQDLEVAERLVEALDPEGRRRALTAGRSRSALVSRGARARLAPPPSRATSQSTTRASGIVTTQEDSAVARYGVKLNVAGLSDLRLPEDLDDPDERHERGVLLEADEVVEERRDDPPDGLRQDDVAERLAAAEPERPRRRVLARVDRLDPGAVDLGHVGRVDRVRATTPQKNGSLGTPGMPQGRDPEAEDEDDEEPGSARKTST